MSAAVNLARMPRRRRGMRGLGYDYVDGSEIDIFAGDEEGGSGDGAVLPPDSSTISSNPTVLPPDTGFPPSGTISVPELQQGNQAAFNNLQTPQPYFGQNSSQFAPFATYATNVGPGGAGGGGGVGARVVTPTTALVGSATPAPAAVTASGVLGSAESLFSTPIYTGSPITWGWVLLGGVVLWLLMRK